MSGGFYNYKQFQLRELWQEMQDQLDRQGKEKTTEELYLSKEYYDEYPEDKLHPKFSEGIQEVLKEAIKYLKVAEVYTQRLDWFFSGDDGEQTFLERLEKDLQKLNLTD